MLVLAIDPGNEKSAYVFYEAETKRIIGMGINENIACLQIVEHEPYDKIVIEMIASYGMGVGKTVFETCLWVGRFIQAAYPERIASLIYRKDEKMFLCHSMKAKDGNIRQAILDLYGGKDKAIGNKKQPGALYGVSKDIWAALAVAITYCGTNNTVDFENLPF